MPDKWPLANGVWSDAANWNGGTKPVPGDDVFADNRTIAIDEDLNVATLRTTARSGGSAGGGFTVATSRNITAVLTAGSSTVLTCSHGAGATVNLAGSVNGSATTGSVTTLINSGAGTVNITGNSVGTPSNFIGVVIPVQNTGSGLINIIGNVTGGAGGGGNQNDGLRNTASGHITIVGNVTGGSGGANGLRNTAGGTVTVTGTVTGGGPVGSALVDAGIYNAGTGNVTINGNVFASATAHGVATATGGRVVINGNVFASGVPALLSGSNTSVFVLNGNLVSPASGMAPYSGGIILIANNGALTHTYRTDNAGVIGPNRVLYTTDAFPAVYPSTTDVRDGTVYGNGTLIGQLKVPAASNVALNVLYDISTLGTANLTVSSIQNALGISSANFDTRMDELRDLLRVLTKISAR